MCSLVVSSSWSARPPLNRCSAPAWLAGLLLLIGLLYLLMIRLKKPGTRQALMYLAFVPLSYILSHLAVKGMSGVSWDMIADLKMILTAAAFACAAMALAAAHLKGRRKEQNSLTHR